jgi:hypothetical protein
MPKHDPPFRRWPGCGFTRHERLKRDVASSNTRAKHRPQPSLARVKWLEPKPQGGRRR